MAGPGVDRSWAGSSTSTTQPLETAGQAPRRRSGTRHGFAENPTDAAVCAVTAEVNLEMAIADPAYAHLPEGLASGAVAVATIDARVRRVLEAKIHMSLLDDQNRIIEKPWYFIKDTQGVIGFVGGEPPVATPDAEVDSIKSQITASEDTERPKVSFEVGETVKINNGPFLNFSGVIEEIEPERGKLKVTVNIFGRNTPVELEYWQVEKS